MSQHIVIGTRGSQLALWQANSLKDKLSKRGVECTLNIIKTKGDQIQDLSFDKLEGKGFFTKEIEEALLKGEVDIAVHSLKDLPTDQPQGLVLAGLSEREDPSDLLIINNEAFNENHPLRLHEKAKVGTSSIRRKKQILDLMSNLEVLDLRGNVPTRIDKLRQGHYDAIILASAGVNRLEIDLSEFKTKRLNPKEFVPAPGQGVVAYQTRVEDKTTRKILAAIHDKKTAMGTNIERKILRLMDGGCQVPLGAHCKVDDQGYFHVHAAYAKDNEKDLLRVQISQSSSINLAEKVVDKLLA